MADGSVDKKDLDWVSQQQQSRSDAANSIMQNLN